MVNAILRLSRETHLPDEPISFQDLVEGVPDHDARSAARAQGGRQ